MTKAEKFNKKLGAEIKKCRKMLLFSQEKLGTKLGLHQAAISRVEEGSQVLTPFQLVTATNCFGVPVDLLLKGDTHLEFFLVEEDETLEHAIKEHQEGGYDSVEDAYEDAKREGLSGRSYRIYSKNGLLLKECTLD